MVANRLSVGVLLEVPGTARRIVEALIVFWAREGYYSVCHRVGANKIACQQGDTLFNRTYCLVQENKVSD
jgi:hypothetical protein